MLPPMIWMLRLMWRFRLLMIIAFVIMLGHIWLNRIEDAWNARSQPVTPTIWCDDRPGPRHIPFIPAEQCGGITSCDRLFNGWGTCSNPK